MSNIKANILQRVRIVFLCVALFVLWIIAKIFIIQFVDGGLWLAKAEKNHVQFRNIKAERGNIYDQHGRDLAVSIPFYRLAFDPSISTLSERNKKVFEQGIDTLCRKLANFFGDKSAFGYKNKIVKARDAGKRYMRINSKSINYLDKKTMESWPIFREGSMHGGVIFEKENKRFKPHAELARRTIGDIKSKVDSVGEKTENGIYGIEYSFDKELGGDDGEAMFAKISSKYWKPLNTSRAIDPINGLDVYTTIDIDIQDVAENALLKALEVNEADNGCAIVMDVNTGEIRAMANLDQITHKNGTFSYRELYNYAVGKRCEPGSTMKLASMMAVLEDNSSISIEGDSIDIGKGVWNFSGTDMKDSHIWNEERKISIKDVFVTSSNVGTAKLVMQYFGESMETQTEFTDYLSEFRLSESIGFQMRGSADPDVMTPKSKRWSGIALPWMSHGYGIEVSPLQMLAFYNAVANNGYYKKPIIVSAIKDDNQTVDDLTNSGRDPRLCSKKTVEKLQEMLLGVVESKKGTAKNIRNDKYLIAGKTGTAKKLSRHRENGQNVYEKKYYSSFAGYFPADAPKYSIIVAIDNAKKGKIYGGDLAAPVFKEIADKIYASEIHMHEHVEFIEKADDLPRIRAGYREDIEYLLDDSRVGLSASSSFDADYVFSRRSDNNTVLLKENSVRAGLVPQVVGMTLKDALPLLENKGLKVKYSGGGRVTAQSKNPGTELLIGSTIKLVLAE